MFCSNRLCLILVCGLILTQACLGGRNSKKSRGGKSHSEKGQSSQTPQQTKNNRGSASENKGPVDLTEFLGDCEVRTQATGSASFGNAPSTNDAEQRRKVMLARILRGEKLLWFGESIGNPASFSLASKSDLIFRVAVGTTHAEISRADINLARDEVTQLTIMLAYVLMERPDSGCAMAIKSTLSPHLRALFEIEDIFYAAASVRKFMSEYKKKLEFLGVKIINEDNQTPSKSTDRPRITDLMLALEKSPQTVTEDSIKSAIEEYGKLKQSKKDGLEVDPRFRLVVDFAIFPADKSGVVLKVDALIKAYTQFRPGYVEKRPIGEGKLPENSDGFLKLMKQALGMLSGEPTKADFMKAKSDYEDAAKRLNDYRKRSDIYDNLDELSKVINLLNQEHSKIFLLQVYPKINDNMNPEETLKLFRQYLSGERSLMFRLGMMQMGRLFLELERAYSQNSNGKSITPEMLSAAKSEYHRGTEAEFEGFFDELLRRFVENLVVWPMEYNSKNNITIKHEDFVADLVNRYSDSRESYFGEKDFGDGTFPPHIQYLEKMFRMATGQTREVPTDEDFKGASEEYLGISDIFTSEFKSGKSDVHKNPYRLYQYNNLIKYPPFIGYFECVLNSRRKIDVKSSPKKLLEKYKALMNQIGFTPAEPSGESN